MTKALGWYPWFAKNEVWPVAEYLELLYANLAGARSLFQLSCSQLQYTLRYDSTIAFICLVWLSVYA